MCIGNIEEINSNTIKINKIKYDVSDKLKNCPNLCIIQLSEDLFKNMVKAMKTLFFG